MSYEDGEEPIKEEDIPPSIKADLVSFGVEFQCGGKNADGSVYHIETTSHCIVKYILKESGEYYLEKVDNSRGCESWG
ncbi:unnamed protein product [Hermetia illucens]|uniref:Uncharacterized protein n=2 Tax=Hermetia illucens TaxID=343691 RepID=A0A7R8YMT1_HERIL|nr:unnamed protein product [Hermetia illucens]